MEGWDSERFETPNKEREGSRLLMRKERVRDS
jgi:hypothetical protein